MPRPRFLTEASLIAGVTASAYLVALAYRLGQMLRLGLPVSLVAISLSDAVFASLQVFTGLFFAVVLIALVGTFVPARLKRAAARKTGVLSSLFIAAEAGAVIVQVILAARRLPFDAGSVLPVWASVTVIVFAALLLIVRAVRRSSRVLGWASALLRSSPLLVIAPVLVLAVCLVALGLGEAGGAAVLGQPMWATVSTGELVVSVSDQRVVLARFAASSSTEATLSGEVRVVPLPSSEMSLTATTIYEVHPASR